MGGMQEFVPSLYLSFFIDSTSDPEKSKSRDGWLFSMFFFFFPFFSRESEGQNEERG